RAAQCAWPLPPQPRSRARTARSQLPGHGSLFAHPRWRLSLPDDWSGSLSWLNHPNAWRPAHIHFSLFGSSTLSRLVTQMYFPDDPLLALDPILNSVPTEQARELLIADYDHGITEPEWALGYRWDIVGRGPSATPV